MRRVKALASWSLDVFLWTVILAFLLIPAALLITACWILAAWILEQPTLGFLEISFRVWGSLISLAAFGISIFFSYLKLKERASNIRRWRRW